MKFSFLTPTRKRPEALLKSINSIFDTFDNTYCDEFEVLAAVDEDDDSYDSLPWDTSVCKVFKFPRQGYTNLHVYYNELCKVAKGDWLWLWNDDCIMETRGWNTRIHPYEDRFMVLNPRVPAGNGLSSHTKHNCTFAIVPKQWPQILGHLSINRHSDVYVDVVGTRLGCIIDLDLDVIHDRFDLTGNNDDQTYREVQPVIAEVDYQRLAGTGDQAEQVILDATRISDALGLAVA